MDKSAFKAKIFKSKTWIHHVSDAIRLVALYRIGGWYFDTDTVIMKSLNTFEARNIFSTDQNTEVIKKQAGKFQLNFLRAYLS